MATLPSSWKHLDWPSDHTPAHANLMLVEGNILDANQDFYIAHQCNCVSHTVSGVAKAIFDKYPYANTYLGGSTRTYGGAHSLVGDGPTVINIYSQYSPGHAKTNHERMQRLLYLYQSLEAVFKEAALLAKPVAIPYLIGCGLAGGNWGNHFSMINVAIENVSKSMKTIHSLEVYMVKLESQPFKGIPA